MATRARTKVSSLTFITFSSKAVCNEHLRATDFQTAYGTPVYLATRIVDMGTHWESQIDTCIDGELFYNRTPAKHTKYADALYAIENRVYRTEAAMQKKADKNGGAWPTSTRRPMR